MIGNPLTSRGLKNVWTTTLIWHLACIPPGMKTCVEDTPPGVHVFRYSCDICHCLSYLLADTESSTSVVIDPCGDLDGYLETAYRMGSSIKHIYLTHVNDDTARCASVLADRSLATVYIGAWVKRDCPFMRVKDGDAFEFGRTRLRVLETPGHRLEDIMILVSDRLRMALDPYLVLTGRTVLAGDIGRPEPVPVDGFDLKDMASMLYSSMKEKIMKLPASTRLLPALELPLDRLQGTTETLGVQRGSNPGFQPMARDEFVRRVCLGMVEASAIGARGTLRLRPVTTVELLRVYPGGIQVIDDRDPLEYAAGHLQGSINIPRASSFASWVGSLVEPHKPTILISNEGHESYSAERLAKAGLDQVSGFLEGGLESIADYPELLCRSSKVSYPELGARIASGKTSLVLDTRPPRAKRVGPDICSLPVPLESLAKELPSLPRGAETIVCDDSPYRASAVGSYLRRQGFEHVFEVAGGLALWGRNPS